MEPCRGAPQRGTPQLGRTSVEAPALVLGLCRAGQASVHPVRALGQSRGEAHVRGTAASHQQPDQLASDMTGPLGSEPSSPSRAFRGL